MHLCLGVLLATSVGCGLAFQNPSSLPRALVPRLHGCAQARLRRSVRCAAEAGAGEGEGEVSIGWRRAGEAAAAELPAGIMPCIPVPAERMSVPGQLREVHLYDVSNLAVAEYCMKNTGTIMQSVRVAESWLESLRPLLRSSDASRRTSASRRTNPYAPYKVATTCKQSSTQTPLQPDSSASASTVSCARLWAPGRASTATTSAREATASSHGSADHAPTHPPPTHPPTRRRQSRRKCATRNARQRARTNIHTYKHTNTQTF